MKRIATSVRPNHIEKIESVCMKWHANGDYWNESAYYEFTAAQVDEIEAVTAELHARCLNAVQHVIDNNLFSGLGIAQEAIQPIILSWENDHPSLYGRFDLAYDGVNPPKMLEYNADTPTSLLEAAVVQWYWMQDKFPKADQFNSLHEALIDQWKYLAPHLLSQHVHFASIDDIEDGVTVTYLQDTAIQAGLTGTLIPMEEIGWDSERLQFVDSAMEPMRTVFKLYPWEDMANEPFFDHLIASVNTGASQWIEPAWKMILSNKGILPILHKLFPGHENILPAFFDEPRSMKQYVRKPMVSREGANVTVVHANGEQSTGGVYDGPAIYQLYSDIPVFDGKRPVIGSWMIGQSPHGMGIREALGFITDNKSQFVPHIFS